MAIIGTFQKTEDGGYAGAIRTLTLNVKAVQFRPVEKEPDSRAPDHRLFSGPVEFGAAWKKTSREGREYLSVRIDDPAFAGAAFATLVEAEDGYSLIWSRSRPTY